MGALVPLFTALLASAPAACPSAVLLLRVATFSFVASSAKAAVSRSEGRQTLSRFGRAASHLEKVAVLRSHAVVKVVLQQVERPQPWVQDTSHPEAGVVSLLLPSALRLLCARQSPVAEHPDAVAADNRFHSLPRLAASCVSDCIRAA